MNSALRDRLRPIRELGQRIPAPLRPWARWVVLPLLGLYLLYVIAGNVFLNTPLGPWVANRKPEKFQIEWGPGVTLWPGRVSVWDVRMKGQAGRTSWAVQAGKASGSVDILPLLHKEVRVPDVVASDVSGGADLAKVRKPPPVPRPGGWILNFQRIRTDSIRGGHFQGLTLEGKGSAEVGFYKQLRGGPLELMPSNAHFDGATLAWNGDTLLRDAALNAKFALARHTRAQAPGIQKLKLIDAALELDGTTAALKTMADAQGHVSATLVPGQGKANAKLGFARGKLTPGSKLTWHMPVTGTDVSGRPRTGALNMLIDVDRDIVIQAKAPPQPDGRLTLDADLRVRGNDVPLQDLRSLIPRSSGHVIGRWQFASLRWLGTFFTNAPWLSLDGAGVVDADVRVVDGRVAAGSHVGVPEVDAVAHVMGNRIKGRARAEGRLDAGADGEPLPRLELVMERFSIAADDAPERPYVDGRQLTLNLETISSFRREDLKQPDAMKEVREALKARLAFADAEVPDLRAYNRYLPPHIRFNGGAGTLSGDLTLDGLGNVGNGAVRIRGRQAQMQVAGMSVRASVDVDTTLRQADLTGHNFNIDGTRVAVTEMSFTEPGGESHSGWWARIAMERARMDWDRPMSISARANVTMKDVGFLLALFSKKRDYPKWVFKIIDSGQARVSGVVQMKGDVVVLDRIDASNQRYDLKARLRLQGKSRVGSLYAKWGVLSCGVAVNNGKRDFHMIRAREWYDSQPNLLR